MKINNSGERETGKGTTRTTHAQRQSGTAQEHCRNTIGKLSVRTSEIVETLQEHYCTTDRKRR